MPKLKTKKAFAKRVKITATGKMKFSRAGRRHLLSNKSPRQKRAMGRAAYVKKCNEARLSVLLPYGLN